MSALLLVIIATFAMSNVANAIPPVPPPDCPGTPFFDGGWETTNVDGCLIHYHYWFRYACDIYYDSYIEEYYFDDDDPNCGQLGPFDPIQYKRIADGCNADLVGRVDPWGKLDPPHPFQIPMCYQYSPISWRFFKPLCSSDWFVIWIDGRFRKMTVPCQEPEELGYCCTTYGYCWLEKTDKDGTTYFELQEQTSGSYPFTSLNCPSSIWIQPVGSDGITVNCNSTCE
jgi:hypothetical protein